MSPAPWIVVVRRDDDAFLQELGYRFDLRWVDLIVDRRRAERRQPSGPLDLDSCAGERRQSATSRYRLTYEAEGLQIYEWKGRMLTHCPECDVEIEYELPHLGQPPARMTMTVHHVPHSALCGGHALTLEAFAESGREVLFWRPPAWFHHRYDVPLFDGLSRTSPEQGRARPAFERENA